MHAPRPRGRGQAFGELRRQTGMTNQSARTAKQCHCQLMQWHPSARPINKSVLRPQRMLPRLVGMTVTTVAMFDVGLICDDQAFIDGERGEVVQGRDTLTIWL